MIFISHSNKDNDFVAKLVEQLNKSGVATWVDFLDIEPATDWNATIQASLKEASILLVVWSNNSILSSEVLMEVAQATFLEKQIIQVRMDDCRPPALLARFQSINFYRDFSSAFESLFRILPIAKRKQRVAELRSLLPQNPFDEIPRF